MRNAIALATLILALGLINWSILEKEAHLSTGKWVFLELAPVDPRSLMQGDYMALNFSLAANIYDALPKLKEEKQWRHDINAEDGYVVVSLDNRDVASYTRIHAGEQLSADESLLAYRVRDGAIKFATNAFFFQEGDAALYEPAKYGAFRVNEKAELLLVSMHDESLVLLGK